MGCKNKKDAIKIKMLSNIYIFSAHHNNVACLCSSKWVIFYFILWTTITWASQNIYIYCKSLNILYRNIYIFFADFPEECKL